MISNYAGVFPPQKLPLSKKDKNWKESCVNGIASRFYLNDDRKQKMKIAYDMYNSKFNLDDLKYVTDPYGQNEGFPAKMQNINIVRSKIDKLMGEWIARPDRSMVYRTDDAIVDDVEQKEKDMIYSAMESMLLSENTTNSEEEMLYLQKRLEQVKNYIGKEFYDPAEQTANRILKYLKEKLDISEEALKGWKDGLVAGESIYYTGIINGEPSFERVNPLYFAFDRDPDLGYIDEGEWACRFMWMTPSAIYDRFFDIMDEKDLNYMLERIETGGRSSSNNTGSQLNTNYIIYKSIDNLTGSTTGYDNDYKKGPMFKVYHSTWKSYKKIGYLTYEDENGEMQTDIVDESYIKMDGETIEWDWITEWWEGYKIETGDDLIIGVQPIEYQDTSIDNPNAGRGVYTGAAYSYDNSENMSLMELMKPLQYFYLILFYRLELTLARDKGKVMLMDLTQIPKGLGMDEYKWMHYLSSQGIAFVNPHDKGWDIPGREGGKPSTNNNITAVDLSMSNIIVEYINLMNKIEEMLSEMSGVSPARQGQIAPSALVGNVREEIRQASDITEPLYHKHGQILRRAYTNLINTAKYAYKVNDKRKINFILENSERMYIKISEDFLYSDYDVFISNSGKEIRDLETLKSLYQPAMQNGASLLDIATIMTEENMSDIKNKLADIEQRNAEMQQQQQQAQMEVEQAKMQQQAEENRIKEDDSIRKAQTDIEVALIKAETDLAKDDNNMTVEESPEDNSLEIEKVNLAKSKNDKDQALKERQLRETERHNKATEAISRIQKKTTSTKK